MNRERRQEFFDVIDTLYEASDRLEDICSDEQDAYDNLSEGLQASRTGDSMLAAVDEMTAINDEIQKIAGRVEKLAKPNKKKKTV